MENTLPVDLFHWSTAVLPLILLLIMLVALRWSGPVSGWIATGAAASISFFIFQAPLDNIAIGFGKGMWEAFFILLVVWPALLLYQITKVSGGFSVIREGMKKHSRNYLFLILGFGWVFASFLQGITGFGAPIAIVAPLLVGIGVKPVLAVVIPLIGHSWANTFGTLAVSWFATKNAVPIENEAVTLLFSSILLWIPNLLAGLMICWLFAKWKGVREGLPAVLIISLIHGGGQLLLTQINPALSNFVPATIALGMLFLLARMKTYQNESELESSSDILEEKHSSDPQKHAHVSLHKAFMPYYVLTGLTVVVLGIPAIYDVLHQFEYGPSFPAADTGHGFEVEAEEAYSPISPLTHSGLYLFVICLFAYLWYKHLGMYKENSLRKIRKGVLNNAVGASLAITGFLVMTEIMSGSGQTTIVAMGIAEISGPGVYVALSSLIGIIGAFMTSSSTSSNVLFSPLHGSVVQTMDHLELPQVIAAQTSGASIGNSIAPANVILGTSTAGISGKDSEVLKYTLFFVSIAGILVAAAALFLHLAAA